MFVEKNKAITGKILFIISIFAFLTILSSPLNNLIFHIDEYFTLGLIKFPLMQGITITADDVHPPLYYILLKIAIKIFSGFDVIFVSKIMTSVPYLLILIISVTKIRKEYGWLTAGLLSFTLVSMSKFFIFYLTIRMYSWAVLFVLLAFIYLKDAVSKSDVKSWFLLSLFTLLGAYTHYFAAISLVIIYLILFVYLLVYQKSEIKKWIISVICLIIGYCPWLLVLFNQLNSVHNSYWIPQININYLIKCFTYYFTANTSIIAILLALIFFILTLLIFIYEYKQKEKSENYYILLGLLLFILTIIAGVILSFVFKPILRVRYLLPATGIFWFSVSILLGKTKNNKFLIVSLILIIILGLFNACALIDTTDSFYEKGVNNQNALSEINQNNSTVICIGEAEVLQFGTYLNESDVYMDCKEVYEISQKDINDLFNIRYRSDLNNTINKNNDSDIYIILWSHHESDLVDENESIYNIKDDYFYKYSNT